MISVLFHPLLISICLVSIIRIYLLGMAMASPDKDFTFDSVSNAFWSCVETNGSVCVACFMTMKPLLARLFPNLILGGGGEERRNHWAVARSDGGGGRPPTIGTRPMRQLPVVVGAPPSLTASLGYEALDE